MKLFETRFELLTEENFLSSYLRFESRQAGVSLIFDPEKDRYLYHAYCMDMEELKELVSQEFLFLDEALRFMNEEFHTWEVVPYEEKKGCSSCVAH